MPEEFSRTTKRKRITIGDSYVDVPVITEISFIDASDRHQEWHYTIDNSALSNRLVHVDTVTGTGSPDIHLPVERIDTWSTIDTADRHWETQMTMDNVTGADSVPPHFSTHTETHVVRYKSPTNANVWIDSELIDSFTVLDPNSRYQETVFTLNNPQTDDEAQADPNDEDISDTTATVDPPWRTDPFQNIIDVHSTSGLILQYFVFRRWGEDNQTGCALANQASLDNSVDGTNGGDWYPVEAEWVAAKRALGQVMPTFDRTLATRTLLSDLIDACLTLSHQFGQTPSSMDGSGGRNPWWEWQDASSRGYQDCRLLDGPDTNQPSAGNPDNHIYTIEIGYALVDDVGTGGFTVPPDHPPWVPPT